MKVPWGDREWQRVVVYGLGASGLAATRLLRSHGVGVVGVDSRGEEMLELSDLTASSDVELRLGTEPVELPPGIDGVVVSPGVSADRPLLDAARRRQVPVVAEVELGFWFAEGPVIGITGSNGKSTTTALTGELLKAAGFDVEVCGNIGVPLSATVEGPAGRIFVTELSSFQLENIDVFRPRAAALLNLAADHLDRHGDVGTYFAAKRALFKNQTVDDVAVLNADQPAVESIQVEARRRLFSRRRRVEDGCYLEGDRIVEVAPTVASRPLFHRHDLPLSGLHNLENAMAAALLSQTMGAQPECFPAALASFSGLPHRLQRVGEYLGISWYDDSKATNFAATERSLEGFADGSVHLILGGRNKGGDPAEIGVMAGRKARRVYLVGEAAAEIESALGDRVSCEMCGTIAAAVEAAVGSAVRGEVVLLSPGCASFDQFENFAERGNHFQDLVRALDG